MRTTSLRLVVVMLASMVAIASHAQKAKHKLANNYYQSFDFKSAADIYTDILSSAKNAGDTLAIRRLSECYRKRGMNVQAEGQLRKLAAISSLKVEDLLNLAEVLKLQGKYNDAIEVYREILTKAPNHDVAAKYIANPSFAELIMRDSAIYTIKNSAINTDVSDFAPTFFTNGKLIYSSAGLISKKYERMYNWNDQPYLNLFVADVQKDSSLANSRVLDKEVNTRYHEGTASYDYRNGVMYFTRNNVVRGSLNKSKTGKLNLGIYTSKYNVDTETWTSPEKFAFNNKEYSVGHPTLSASGNRIYFVSDMPGGFGGTDIYYSEKSGETWSTPANAGSKINTSADEMFPFMVGDSTLYFSSRGHLCIGGFDIFFTNPFNDKPVENIGYPANSHYDDFAFICFPEEIVGYFSSTRAGGKGDDDIYEFRIQPVDSVLITGTVFDLESLSPVANAIVSIPTEDGSVIQVLTDANGKYSIKAPYAPVVTVKANKLNYIEGEAKAKTNPRSAFVENVDIKVQKIDYMAKGRVTYSENGKPAEQVLVKLFELAGRDTLTIDSVYTSATGMYSFPLKGKKNYLLEVTKAGYARQTDAFATNDANNKIYERDFKLFKPEVGTVVRLDNIYYDYNSDVIRADAALELNKLVRILKDNPTMKIELSSHSDSRGGDAYNLKLSDRRAKSAVAYMVTQGIAADRMIGKGYGEQKILNHCKNDVKCTDEEHQFNRRTEFTILAF